MSDNGWHVDKRVSIGHIVTTTAVAVGVVMWLSNIDKRVELNTLALNNNSARIERAENRQNEQFGKILQRLDSIEAYLRNRNP